ncbi:MAG: murein DD-endopeptidase MepM/ murein hydrolase activator NlpD [Polyangiales bacterium]|jgi:murein DD-endopeptidase MepM/ murein hydrolase activator NlpD
MSFSSAVTRLALGALVFLVAAAGAAGALKALDHVGDFASMSRSALVAPTATPDAEISVEGINVEDINVEGTADESVGEESTDEIADEEEIGDEPTTPGSADETGRPLVAPSIEEWLPDARRCHRRGRYFCDGPRHVPAPHGEGAERAARLGLGTRRTYNRVLSGPADPTLLAEAGTPDEDLLWPVPEGVRGRGFGYVRRGRLSERLHRGVDIPAAVGALVRSTNEGLVIYADNEVRGYGNLVVVLHGDDTRTLYAHLERAYVFAGQTVTRGEVVGAVGRTGLTRAPHLHFEWRRRAVPRNPSRRFVDRPDEETERRLYNDQLRRRTEGRARLAEQREARERRQARRAEREAREILRTERARALDTGQTDPIPGSRAEAETNAIP